MLNLLSMDFDIASYADDLRYNSFMRERNTRETDAEGNAALGDGFFKGVFPKNRGQDFCKLEGAALEAWRRHYGSSVVDFGAGKLNNTRTLRKAGIHVAAFEPYFVTVGENIHKAKSVEIAEKFLDDVEAGTPFTSVFISSVFNSVPFMADRKQIAVIAAALCSPGGRTVCWCQSNKAPQFVNTKKKFLAAEKTLTFDLDYEPNTILGDIGNHPKAQKGHTEEEMREIFAPCFRKVDRLEMIQKFWYMEVSEPIVDPEALGAALDFESSFHTRTEPEWGCPSGPARPLSIASASPSRERRAHERQHKSYRGMGVQRRGCCLLRKYAGAQHPGLPIYESPGL